MATATVKKASKQDGLIIQNISIAQLNRTSKNMQDWIRAIRWAENVYGANRKALYELYEQIKLEDGFLQSVINKRIRAVKNTRLNLTSKDGLSAINDKFQAPWMLNLLQYIIERRFYGHSLVEFEVQKGEIAKAKLIYRHHVDPQKGIIMLKTAYDQTGIPYREKPYSDYTLEIGDWQDLGLLATLSKYAIFKKGNWEDWAEHAEMFGAPIRVYTYDPIMPDSRIQAEEAAKEAGNAAYIVVPKGVGLELQKGSDSATPEMYDRLRKALNEEISITVLGQTMTTVDGSSRSQGEVHLEVEHEINYEDKLEVEYILNWQFKEKLLGFGYPMGDDVFKFDGTEKIPIEKQLEMDLKIADRIPVDDEYFYQKYGIPKPKAKKTVDNPTNADASNSADTQENLINVKKKLSHGGCCEQLDFAPETTLSSIDIQGIIDEIIDKLYKEKKIFADKKLYEWTKKQLEEALAQGFELSNINYEEELAKRLTDSAAVFSAHKNIHFIKALNEALTIDGELVSFADFKKKALSIHENYNVNYLRAEYNVAVASAQNAARWQIIEKNKDIAGLLKYQTIGDQNVRPAHRALNGVTRPVDDTFWNSFYPPNGWNCRCEVLQVDGETVTSDSEVSKIIESKAVQNEVPPEFRNNAGKTGKIFSDEHPYYNVTKAEKRLVNKLLK